MSFVGYWFHTVQSIFIRKFFLMSSSIYFRFLPSIVKSIGDFCISRQNVATKSPVIFCLLYRALLIGAANGLALLGDT
jgi:hypothetical protein